MRKKIVAALAAALTLVSVPAQASTLVYGRVITNNNYAADSGYRSAWSAKLPYGHYHIEAYITDQGNEFHQSEDCIGKINVYRASDEASLGYLRAETWPVDLADYHYHVYMDGYWTGSIQVKMAVAGIPHYSSQDHSYINLYDACRLIVSVQR